MQYLNIVTGSGFSQRDSWNVWTKLWKIRSGHACYFADSGIRDSWQRCGSDQSTMNPGWRDFEALSGSRQPSQPAPLDWISGYLDNWIMVTNLLLHPQSGLLCGAALPGAFFSRENRSLGFCNLKHCFLHSTKTIFNGTRLDRCGLKNECVRFKYGTKLMARKFNIWN